MQPVVSMCIATKCPWEESDSTGARTREDQDAAMTLRWSLVVRRSAADTAQMGEVGEQEEG